MWHTLLTLAAAASIAYPLVEFLRHKKAYDAAFLIVGIIGIFCTSKTLASGLQQTSPHMRALFGLSAIAWVSFLLVRLKVEHAKLYALTELFLGIAACYSSCWSIPLNAPINLSQFVALFGSMFLLFRGIENTFKTWFWGESF